MAVYLGSEKVSSGGGIGGGSTGGGVFIVNFTQNEDESNSIDKTCAEITDAFNNNMVVLGNLDGYILRHIRFNENYGSHEFVFLKVDPEKATIGSFIVNNDNSVSVMVQTVALTRIL